MWTPLAFCFLIIFILLISLIAECLWLQDIKANEENGEIITILLRSRNFDSCFIRVCPTLLKHKKGAGPLYVYMMLLLKLVYEIRNEKVL